MRILPLIILLVSPTSTWAARLACDHAIYGAPFASVELELLADGALGPAAVITMYGKSHEESVTQEQGAPGERFHLWISKENPNNAIEMMVYEKNGEIFPSKMINPRLGWGREIGGSCRELP